MMTQVKWMLRAVLLVAAGLVFCPQSVMAQRPDDGGRARRQGAVRSPERIQERIDRLLDAGVSEDDPQIKRLRVMLEMVGRSGRERGGRERRGLQGRAGFGEGDRVYSVEEIKEFVEQHPDLKQLLMTSSDPNVQPARAFDRNLRRFRRQVSQIMTAKEDGNEELSSKLLAHAKIQFAITELVIKYKKASEESAEKSRFREEISELVRQRVSIDLDVEALRIQGLRASLVEQEARIAEDRTRTDEIASSQLERILPSRGMGSGAASPQGADSRKNEESDSD